jgi:hypothetical protein
LAYKGIWRSTAIRESDTFDPASGRNLSPRLDIHVQTDFIFTMHSIPNHTGLVVICLVLAGIIYIRSIRTVRAGRVRRAESMRSALEAGLVKEDTTLPSDFYNWIYVHQSPTVLIAQPDRLVVESYPYIYVPPLGYADFLRTGVLPERTIVFRRLQLASPVVASTLAGRSCQICFSPDRAQTAHVRIKDTMRFHDTDGWGYFQFDLSRANNPV